MWYLDSGCSKHMTGEASQLINLKWKPIGFVTYRDNNRGRIIGVGDIGSENVLGWVQEGGGGELNFERF